MEPGQIIQWVLIGAALAIVVIDKILGIKRRRNGEPGNPGYGERLATLEKAMENVEKELGRIRRKLDFT